MEYRALFGVFSLCCLVPAAQAADVSQDAIDACIDKLRAQSPGTAGRVLHTEFSQANSLVTLQDGNGKVWNCLVGNDGSAPDLEPNENSARAGHSPVTGGPSHWVINVKTSLNLHSAPSPTAPTVASLAGGTIVENRSCTEAAGRVWCEVADGDASGWTAQEFLSPSKGRQTTLGATERADSSASTTSERIRFGAGRTGTDIAGILSPGSSKRYLLGAKNGQDLTVEFWTTDPAIEYQIFLPNGSMLLDRISNTKRYGGSLFKSGDHVIEVINRSGSDASYNMSVEIR